MSNDDLGDRMKRYEQAETGRQFMPLLPIMARIDGRCFSTFTRGMTRPFDLNMQNTMIHTTTALVEELGAVAGYTQSDEITLAFQTSTLKSQHIFDGKVFKMTSIAASLATSIFIEEARKHWPEKITAGPVCFDARFWQVPNRSEAANTFLWRENDATKNAISMAARTMFSPKQMHQKSGNELQEMMFQEHQVNFNDYPTRFKRGTFILRRKLLRPLPAETLAKIPEKYRPAGPIARQVCEPVDLPRFSRIANREAVLFDGESPWMRTDGEDKDYQPGAK